jgi:hypothetical protein
MRKMKIVWTAALACLLSGAGTASVSAQFAVFDAATTARNQTTAALKELLYRLQVQQHDKLLDMARRLSALTNLRKYRLDDVPRWRTHGSAGFLFASGYLDALTSGDPAGAAYNRLVAAIEQSPRLAGLPLSARRLLMSRLANVDLADAAATAGIHASGQSRLDGRRNEIEAIDALERDVIDPSLEQSTTAVLDKISGAAVIGARQRQERIQLLTNVLEQLLAEGKLTRDAEASALNMQLTRWRDGRAADEAFVAGSGDALSTWRQP